MISIFDMVYISVESRKGGVGKTTTAITLAEALLSEGYQVLLLDLDITGTALDSSFINSNSGLIHEVKQKGETVNLVRLFRDVFLAGKTIPVFALAEDNKSESFSKGQDKCNYIGSNIYEDSKGTKLLEDPRVLYDAYHAYWLMEFIKGISKSFAASLENDKVAVILDNSPGFSSLENCIHDFLTDLGPKEGKVLLVSTIDKQDIDACRQSKKNIEKLLFDKVAAGEYYRSMVTTSKGERIDSPAFDYVWNSLCASGGQYPDYHSSKHEGEPPYISLLVNKVPRPICEQLYSKGVLYSSQEKVVPFLNHLQYYYSNSILKDKDIEHQQVYMDQFSAYSQSGNVAEIVSDDTKYLELCEVSNRIGLGSFFKTEWAPLAHFRDLIEIMKEYGALKDPINKIVSTSLGGYLSIESRITDEVKVVEKFVLDNLSESSKLYLDLTLIVDYTISVLNNVNVESIVDFHPEHPKLVEIGDFVSNFVLASYRLHIYRQVCNLLNMLIEFCLGDNENSERFNKDSFSSWFDKVLEGRVVEQDYLNTLSQMLDDRRNARELSAAVKGIIKLWEL